METRVKKTNKMLVRKVLSTVAQNGTPTLLEEYNAIFSPLNKFPFTRFVTVTFSAPMTDEIEVVEVCRLIKRRINKFFYRRQASPLKFAFIIEADKLGYKGRSKYHIHILMTEPINILRKATKLQKILWFQNRFHLDWFITTQIRKIRSISLNSRARVKRTDIKQIYNQNCLSDYLLKQLKPSSRSRLYIDFMNSDLSWSDGEYNSIGFYK